MRFARRVCRSPTLPSTASSTASGRRKPSSAASRRSSISTGRFSALRRPTGSLPFRSTTCGNMRPIRGHMRKTASVFVVALVVAAFARTAAEERVDQEMFWKFRQEGTNNSKILQTMHMLTDVYGPRLTGSPNLKAAGEWAIEQMHAWGLKQGRLEPWDFNRVGWSNERLTAHLVSPVKDALVVEALGWTPGTNGVVRAQALQITLPQRATRATLTTYLDSVKASVKGRVVLVNPPQQVLVSFNPAALRRDDQEVLTQLNAAPQGGPAQQQQQQQPAQQAQQQQPRDDQPLNNNQLQQQLNQFLVDN